MHRTFHLSHVVLIISIAVCAIAVDSSTADTLQVRNLTYISGESVAEDDDTWVVGGAEGSSILLIHDRAAKRTRWVFLHGKHMYLSVPGEKPEIVTNRPGWSVVSEKGDWDELAKPMSTRELSRHLEKLYKAHGVLHAPFLTPQDPITGTGDPGASVSEARALLHRMRLNMMITGSNTDGRVVEQSPAGGTPVAPGTSIWVRLDGPTTSPSTEGDTFAAPITITGATGTHSYTAIITPEHHDSGSVAAPDCGPNGTDLFWKIDAATGPPRTFSATLNVVGGPRITLSAWTWNSSTSTLVPALDPSGNPACAKKRKPSIEFTDGGNDAYIVADVDTRHLDRRGPEELKLEVVWP